MDFRPGLPLTRALEPLKQTWDSHRRSLALLDSALLEFEETFNQLEQKPGRPQAQQIRSSVKESEQCRLTVV